MSTCKKIILKKLKGHDTIWHPETKLVFKSKAEKVVIGIFNEVNDSVDELTDESINLCETWKFKIDESLFEEVEEEPEPEEQEPEPEEQQQEPEPEEQEQEQEPEEQEPEEQEQEQEPEEQEPEEQEQEQQEQEQQEPEEQEPEPCSNKDNLLNLSDFLNMFRQNVSVEKMQDEWDLLNKDNKKLCKELQQITRERDELLSKLNTLKSFL